MTRACARFFAADWEASSFLEFFVDLQLRVSEDARDGAGRTLARLADHARFALQLTLVRSVDSFVAYLAEVALVVSTKRNTESWHDLVAKHDAKPGESWAFREQNSSSVPVDVSLEYATSLAYGNVRQLDQLFVSATRISLFENPEELQRVARLSSLRNLIAHGRIFASDDLVALVDETASVSGLMLDLKGFRKDLDFLRVVVARVDRAASTAWHLELPVSREELFDAISKASVLPDAASPPSIAVPPRAIKLR
jgi:hypothetical protein